MNETRTTLEMADALSTRDIPLSDGAVVQTFRSEAADLVANADRSGLTVNTASFGN